MLINILMPALSPTMTEGNLAKWLKKEGDKVSPGDIIAEIETDKATMEVEAVDGGILAKIIVLGGTENVKVNELIAIIAEEDDELAKLDEYLKNLSLKVASPISKEPVPMKEALLVETGSLKEDRIFISPLAKRIATSQNMDYSKVTGTGPRGRIIKADIENYKPSEQKSIAKPSGEVEYIKLSNMRKTIAKRLLESKQNIPHFYLSIECIMDKLLEIRKDMNHSAPKNNEDKPLYKLSVNDFIIKACGLSMRDVPAVNSCWGGDSIMKYNNIDIAVAVAIEDGLITPIVRDADSKSISRISNEMKDLASKAKAGKLMPEEYQGGSLSISNLGMYNIKNFKAIINPPQACILAIGASSERVIAKNGQISIAQVMDVSLSCDHRVVDGAVAAKFLSALKHYIENPINMFV